MKDFNDIYYNSVECVRCSLCLDRCPAVRAAGTDKAPMYSSVYSALGSRFDLEMVTEEAFQCIDCYECESACPVNVPIADTMAYIRRLCKEKNTVPDGVESIVQKAENGENILGTPSKLPEGKAEIAGHRGQRILFGQKRAVRRDTEGCGDECKSVRESSGKSNCHTVQLFLRGVSELLSRNIHISAYERIPVRTSHGRKNKSCRMYEAGSVPCGAHADQEKRCESA